MNNAALIILTAILTAAALAIGGLFGAEILRVLRDMFARPSGRGNTIIESDEQPEAARTGVKSRRNRATVERLITHFEEKDPRLPGTKES